MQASAQRGRNLLVIYPVGCRWVVWFGGLHLMWQDFATMMHPDTIQRLRNFRNELHMLFGKRADALFELCDAAVTAGLSPSLVYLSLEAIHRRGWGSLYAALAEGEIDVEQMRSLC